MSDPIKFDDLPDAALIKQRDLLTVLPFSGVTLWRQIKAGTFPKPHNPPGMRLNCWRVADVRAYLATVTAREAA